MKENTRRGHSEEARNAETDTRPKKRKSIRTPNDSTSGTRRATATSRQGGNIAKKSSRKDTDGKVPERDGRRRKSYHEGQNRTVRQKERPAVPYNEPALTTDFHGIPPLRLADPETLIMASRLSWVALVTLNKLERMLALHYKGYKRPQSCLCYKMSAGVGELAKWITLAEITNHTCKVRVVNLGNLGDHISGGVPAFGGLPKPYGGFQNLEARAVELARLFAYDALRESITEQFERSVRSHFINPAVSKYLSENPHVKFNELLSHFEENSAEYGSEVGDCHPLRAGHGLSVIRHRPHEAILCIISLNRPFAEVPHEQVMRVRFDDTIQRSDLVISRAISAYCVMMAINAYTPHQHTKVTGPTDSCDPAHHPIYDMCDEASEVVERVKRNPFADCIAQMDKEMTNMLNFRVPAEQQKKNYMPRHVVCEHNPDEGAVDFCTEHCLEHVRALYSPQPNRDGAFLFYHHCKRPTPKASPNQPLIQKGMSREIRQDKEEKPKFLNIWGWNAYQRHKFLTSHVDSVLIYNGLSNVFIESPCLILSSMSRCVHMLVVPHTPESVAAVEIAVNANEKIAQLFPDHRITVAFERTMNDSSFQRDSIIQQLTNSEILGLPMLFTKHPDFFDKARVLAERLSATRTRAYNCENDYIWFAINIDYFSAVIEQTKPVELAEIVDTLRTTARINLRIIVEPLCDNEAFSDFDFSHVLASAWGDYPRATWPPTLDDVIYGFEGKAKRKVMNEPIH